MSSDPLAFHIDLVLVKLGYGWEVRVEFRFGKVNVGITIQFYLFKQLLLYSCIVCLQDRKGRLTRVW